MFARKTALEAERKNGPSANRRLGVMFLKMAPWGLEDGKPRLTRGEILIPASKLAADVS